MGKHKPIWDPSTDCGDYVVATSCTDVYITGKKMQQKLYYKQTTRPGALKSLNMEGMVKKWGGGEILKRAVSGMLPKNRLRKPRLERLKGNCAIEGTHLRFANPSQSMRVKRTPIKRTSSNLTGECEGKNHKARRER